MKKIFYILLAVFSTYFLNIEKTLGQDFHYSQFYNSPMNLNPALTGVFSGDHRMIGNMRQQWAKIDQGWLTVGAAYDSKYTPKKFKKSFIGYGLQFNYDRDGLSKLNLSNLNISGSYNYFINKNNIITGGLTLGFASRGFNPSALSWDKQWNGFNFNINRNPGEAYNAQRVTIFETALGLNYRWQKSKRTNVDFGAGLFHITSPSANFYNLESQNLPRRLSVYVKANFEITKFLDLQVQAINQTQGEYTETLFGGLLKFYLSQKKGRGAQLHIGAGYRTSESVFPTIALKYKNYYASLSYDVDLSPFKNYTSKRGGPEFHFIYIITKVKPLNNHKACPIF